jgi:glycosyltransferase involved in cell wall biosynthesis
MKYNTSLRPYTSKRLEEIERADILIGIPCYNNETTIPHVVQMVSHGLHKYYKNLRAVIMISDGGSTDDTREVTKDVQLIPWQEKIVSIYRGPAGKGTALRAIFEAAERLSVKACMVVDSDLRSINSGWVKALLEPLLNCCYDFVAPIYTRYKYDGTITNNIVYNLTRTLYGKRIRQPIGGDFAFSQSCAKYFLSQDVWDTNVARYGIDIWMTTNAIVNNFRVCQSNLGVKVHDAKDPAAHLAPMFREVVWTLFTLMEQNEQLWKTVRGSETTDVFGTISDVVPEPIQVDVEALVRKFKIGYEHFGVLWKKVFTPESFGMIKTASRLSAHRFSFEIDTWVRILYELASIFHHWPHNRYKLLEIATPLYYGRVASFVNRTRKMDSVQAEEIVEAQAQAFEDKKDFLVQMWERPFQEDADMENRLQEI